jgi:lauroyl/myristoyl acyltransferase
MALVSYNGTYDPAAKFPVPTWVVLTGALAMGLGTASGGWRIIKTMGSKIFKLRPIHGFRAETGAATLLQQWMPYAALRATASTLHLFGTRQNLQTAAAIGTLFARMGPTRMRRAERHVRWAFPDKSDAEVRALALASVQHMFQLFLVDSVAGPQLLNEHGWGRHVEFGSLGSTMELLLQERPAIFVTGHSGNWEFLGLSLSLLGFRMSALARPLDNPFIDAWLLGMRQRRGLEVLVKWAPPPRCSG